MIKITQQFVFWSRLRHRRKLKHITYKNDLLSTERLSSTHYLTQCVVNRIDQITSYHGYFINNDGICMKKRKNTCLIQLT